MPARPAFSILPFSRRDGRLIADAEVAAAGPAEALAAAAALVPGRALGALALRLSVDDETGHLWAASILGAFGEVPDDVSTSLAGW